LFSTKKIQQNSAGDIRKNLLISAGCSLESLINETRNGGPMKQRVATVIVLLICLFLFNGCQESESEIVKKAKLVGNENIQLKKQLTEKDKEIMSLKDEITQLESDIAKMNQEFGESTLKILQMVADSKKSNETLVKENEELKEQLKQLQNQ
jgi:septal ring factor EnvC (AmiA/AmiB activator)